MQVSLERIGTLGRRLTVSVPAEEVEAGVKARVRAMQRTVRINGFRPGKVPTSVIERRFGADIEREVLNELMRDSLLRALREQSLDPVRPPRVERAERNSDGTFTYTVSFEEIPEIPEFDLSTLEIERPEAAVTDSDVANMIETLRRQRARWVSVERPARVGDMVLFEFAAEFEQGRYPAEGKERAGTILGSQALGAEFEACLLGKSAGAGEEVELDLPVGFGSRRWPGSGRDCALRCSRFRSRFCPRWTPSLCAPSGSQAVTSNASVPRFAPTSSASSKRR